MHWGLALALLMPQPLKEGVGIQISLCPFDIRTSVHSYFSTCTFVLPSKQVCVCITLKSFVIQTWNFMEIWLRLWTCAPGYFHPPKINIYGVMGLDFGKKHPFWQGASEGICVLWTHFVVTEVSDTVIAFVKCKRVQTLIQSCIQWVYMVYNVKRVLFLSQQPHCVQVLRVSVKLALENQITKVSVYFVFAYTQ